MVKVYRRPDGKVYVRAKLSGFGEAQHTLPCRAPHQCAICMAIPPTNVRAYAKEVGDRLLASLRTKRTQGPQNGSLTSTVRTLGDVLGRYRERRLKGRETLGKQEWAYSAVHKIFANIPIDHAWNATQALVERYRDTGEYKPATINRLVATIKAAVKEAYETRLQNGIRLIPDNYLSSFPMLLEQNIEYLILSKDQMTKFWEALDVRLRPFAYFAWRVPIREGEAFNLTRDHIDWFNKLIRLPYEYTKQGEQRQIKIVPEMEGYVREFLASPAKYLFNRGKNEDFAPLGYMASENRIEFSLRRHWKRAAVAAGQPRYNLHKCRQQAVMSLWQAGWTEEEIRMYGGWAPPCRGKDAFYCYFNKEMALWIKQGQHAIDLSWQQSLKEEVCANA